MLTTCSYTISSKKIIFSLFCESSLLDHILWKVVVLKLLRKSKPGWFLLESSEMFLLNFLEYKKETVICIWCHNIDPADHANFMWLLVFFFYNFEPNLWKCYHATKDNSHLTFLAKMTQHGRNVVILTFQSCIDVAITTSVIYWKVNLLSITEATLLQRNKFDLVVSTLWRRHGFDVMISRLQQCCEYNRHSVSWVEPTFWQS